MNSKFITDINATGESLIVMESKEKNYQRVFQVVKTYALQLMLLLTAISLITILWLLNKGIYTTQGMIQDNNKQVKGFQTTYGQLYYGICEEMTFSKKEMNDVQNKIEWLCNELRIAKEMQDKKNLELERLIAKQNIFIEEETQKIKEERDFDREQLKVFYQNIVKKKKK